MTKCSRQWNHYQDWQKLSMSVRHPIAGLTDLMGRFQFARVSSQILRSFWHIACKAVEWLKGSKEPVKFWLLLGGETELENSPSRHIETCPVPASSGHVQQVISVFWHCGCQISTSPGLWSGTHTSKTTQVEIHTHKQKLFSSLVFFINALSSLRKIALRSSQSQLWHLTASC